MANWRQRDINFSFISSCSVLRPHLSHLLLIFSLFIPCRMTGWMVGWLGLGEWMVRVPWVSSVVVAASLLLPTLPTFFHLLFCATTWLSDWLACLLTDCLTAVALHCPGLIGPQWEQQLASEKVIIENEYCISAQLCTVYLSPVFANKLNIFVTKFHSVVCCFMRCRFCCSVLFHYSRFLWEEAAKRRELNKVLSINHIHSSIDWWPFFIFPLTIWLTN